MSQRDRDASAAMREILRAGLQLAKVADCAPLAEMAWSVADAMEAERVRRVPPVPPFVPEPVSEASPCGHPGAVEKGPIRTCQTCHDELLGALTDSIAPDVASLQAELAKLRAVAEAAFLCVKDGTGCGTVWVSLLDALDAAGMTGWRTAP